MLANRGSSWVKERRLTEKYEGPVGGEISLRLGNLFKPPTYVNGRGPRTFRSSPGNGGTQCIVNLEGAGAVAETFQPLAVMRWQLRVRDAKKLSGSAVGENEISFWELSNFMIDFNTAAKVFQITGEGIWESLSAAAQNRPASCVTGSYESQTNGCRSWGF
jgi:hypothetical protein